MGDNVSELESGLSDELLVIMVVEIIDFSDVFLMSLEHVVDMEGRIKLWVLVVLLNFSASEIVSRLMFSLWVNFNTEQSNLAITFSEDRVLVSEPKAREMEFDTFGPGGCSVVVAVAMGLGSRVTSLLSWVSSLSMTLLRRVRWLTSLLRWMPRLARVVWLSRLHVLMAWWFWIVLHFELFYICLDPLGLLFQLQ